jgi:carbon monoxide dehydrogenase subunit G
VKGDAQIGGLMARIGQRLLGSVNRMMMDRFFACLQEKAGRHA